MTALTAEPVRLDVDVAVVGGGFAGTAAATRCAELGASVALFEPRDELGGTALYSGGMVHIWGAQTWPEFRELCPTADEALARAMFDGWRPFIDWAARTWTSGTAGQFMVRGRPTEAYRLGRGFLPREKQSWFEDARRRLQDRSVEIKLGFRATDLLVERGRVVGLVAKGSKGNGPETIVRAKATVLAAGGFQNDSALLDEYVSPFASRAAMIRAVPEARGDGLRLAEQADARLTRAPTSIYGHFMPEVPGDVAWPDLFYPMVATAYYVQHGIVVNERGMRFVDEGSGEYSHTANEAVQQEPGRQWVIIDRSASSGIARPVLPWAALGPKNAKYWQYAKFVRLSRAGRRLVPRFDSIALARHRGAHVIKAGSLTAVVDRLAEQGVDGAVLTRTLREYDAALADGAGGELVPRRTARATRLLVPPFYAVPVGVGISMTYGGVAIDARARVLSREGRPVPGLFAVPGTAGGVQDLYYVGALASCGIFGHIAGTEAASAAAA